MFRLCKSPAIIWFPFSLVGPFVSVVIARSLWCSFPCSVLLVSVVLLGPFGVRRSFSVLGWQFSSIAFTSRHSLFHHHPSSCIAFMAHSLSHSLLNTCYFLCSSMVAMNRHASRYDRHVPRICVIIILATLCYCEAGKSLPKAKPKASIKAHNTKQGAAVCKGKRCTTQAQSGHQ